MKDAKTHAPIVVSVDTPTSLYHIYRVKSATSLTVALTVSTDKSMHYFDRVQCAVPENTARSHIRVVGYSPGGEIQRQAGAVIGHIKLADSGGQVCPLKPEVPTTVVFLVDTGDAQIVKVSPRALPQPVHTSYNVDL